MAIRKGILTMAKIITPVITVFDKNEKPDLAGNKKVIDYLIDHGVDGILVLGSAGEFPNLTPQERLDFFKFYKEYVHNRVELFAGTGCVSYSDTLMLTSACIAMGYTAAMVLTPYYYALNQEQMYTFYDRLADEVNGDLYLYNFPPRSGSSIDADVIHRLVTKHTNIIGLKDSVTEPNHTNDVFRATENIDFKVYSGFDDQFLLNIANGGAGCIGALSNIVPDIWASLVKAVNDDRFSKAVILTNLIQRLMPIYGLDSNPALLIKMLMNHRGLNISETEVFPFNQINDLIYKKAERILDNVLRDYQNITHMEIDKATIYGGDLIE